MVTRQRLVFVPIVACCCAISPVFLTACGISFKSIEPNFIRRDELRKEIASREWKDPALSVTDGEKANPRLPCRIAVYVNTKVGERGDLWTREDREALVQTCNSALIKGGFATTVFQLPDDSDDKNEVAELRQAAAKEGADLLFVVRGTSATDEYLNLTAVLNLTVVGGFIVPASHRDALFVIKGDLIDVNAGRVYPGIQAEGLSRIIRPTFLIDEKLAITRAKKKAVAAFGDELLRRMRTLTSPAGRP